MHSFIGHLNAFLIGFIVICGGTCLGMAKWSSDNNKPMETALLTLFVSPIAGVIGGLAWMWIWYSTR
jgi:hypothetical protein